MLNVGWLSGGRPFPRRPVPRAFAYELRRMSQEPVHLTHGPDLCEFSEPPDDISSAEPRYREVWKMFSCGNGELYVQGETRIVYCAPSLLAHSVSEHRYQPPLEFVAAVLYQRALRPISRTSSLAVRPGRSGVRGGKGRRDFQPACGFSLAGPAWWSRAPLATLSPAAWCGWGLALPPNHWITL